MNGPFIVSRGPSGECHCAFQTSLCYYIPLFALHVVLSSDWLSWCPGCFSRHPWIPFIQPSFKSFHVCRHLPSHNPTPWGCELGRIPWDGEITIKPRAFVTIEGFAESCNSVLHRRLKSVWLSERFDGVDRLDCSHHLGNILEFHYFWCIQEKGGKLSLGADTRAACAEAWLLGHPLFISTNLNKLLITFFCSFEVWVGITWE